MWSLALIILHEKNVIAYIRHQFAEVCGEGVLVNKLCPANNLMLQGEDRGRARQPEGRTQTTSCLVKGSGDNGLEGVGNLMGSLSNLCLLS